MYKVEWKEEAVKSLEKLDKTIAVKIRDKVNNELAKNPHKKGEPLVSNLKGFWKYRFSKYRVIYEIKETELIVLILQTGHRRKIYKKV